MVNNKIISAKDYIMRELKRERYSYMLDDFNFNLPFDIMDSVFREHYSSIFLHAGEVMGSRGNDKSGIGHYGIQLTETPDNKGEYKLDFVMGYIVKELHLGDKCSQLIHEFNTKYNREENLKNLLD